MNDPLISLFARRDAGLGVCTMCKRRSAEGEDQLCRACAWVAKYEPAETTVKQVAGAVKLLRSPSEMA